MQPVKRALPATLNVLGLLGIIAGIVCFVPFGWIVGVPVLFGGLVLRAAGEIIDRLPAKA